MKRTLIVTISLLALLAAAALAQEHPMMRKLGPAEAHALMMGEGRIVEFLQLTPDQKASWDSLHQELGTTIQPLAIQAGAGQQKLQSLLSAATPDPTAIGNQLLAIHALELQIRAAHDATAQKVEALLTPDQKTKFEAWKATQPEGHARMMVGPCMKE